jgi:hypothetical protein
MSEDFRISGVKKSRTGSTPRVDPEHAITPELSLRDASTKWKHLRSEVKDLPWSGVPDEMLRDFLLAGTGEIIKAYGDNAALKSAEVFAIQVLSRGATEAKVFAAWPEAGASACFELKTQPLSASDPVAAAPGIEFTLEGGADKTEEEVRQGLRDAASDKDQTRLVLDPVAQFPAQSLRSIVEQAETLMGDPLDKANQFDVLLVSASVLLMWKQLEDRNADVSSIRMSDLYDGEVEVAAGQEVILESTRVALDPGLALPEKSEPRSQYSVRYRPS